MKPVAFPRAKMGTLGRGHLIDPHYLVNHLSYHYLLSLLPAETFTRRGDL